MVSLKLNINNCYWINLLVALSSFLALSANISYAKDSYQSEISAKYYHLKDDDHNKVSRYTADANIFFSTVNTAGHPLAEAAFLERIGYASFQAGKYDSKASGGPKARGPFYGVSTTYRKPNLPIALLASYTRTDIDYKSGFSGDMKSDAYGVGVGYFLGKSLLAQANFVHSESDSKIDSPVSTTTKAKFNTYYLTGKYVKELGNGTAYNVAGLLGMAQQDSSRSSRKTNWGYGISGDYYFNQKISLGANVTIDSGENKSSEGIAAGLRLVNFINSQFAVKLGYSRFFAENSEGQDDNSYTVDVTLRF
ncbi:MAG: putative porin [Nitrospirota bacterium]|nr:putative porin [Nitrospirota bacterium]